MQGKTKPDISILIPVYNVEKYLTRCLNSVFSQEFTGIYEVIAVDDASTDNSLQILKQYQEKESRLNIIENDVNNSLSITRSSAMQAASGDYIMHVDSDDWLLPGSLKRLYKKCKETDADVIVFNFLRENSEGKQSFVKGIQKELRTTDKQKVQHYFFGACWNKIVKRALTENMVYSKAAINSEEDLLYSSEILLRARLIYLLPSYHYVWFNNPKSITGLGNPRLFLQQQDAVLKQIQSIINKYGPDSKIINNLLNYIENRIHVEVLKIQFENKESVFEDYKLITNLFPLAILAKHNINNLQLSIKNKLKCFIRVVKFLGLRSALGIIYRVYKFRNV